MITGDVRPYLEGIKSPVKLGKDEFSFSVMCLDHGHIYSMTDALIRAGATLRYVYDSDIKKAEAFKKAFPEAALARCEEEVLSDYKTLLIAGAAVTSRRCELGIKAMKAGKDYFTDKAPFTELSQLEEARKAIKETGRRYMVYYSERLHVESAVLAGYMIEQGEIGRVLSVNGFGPHRLSPKDRPGWFFKKKEYGGILCDIGSHQIEQYLFFAGEDDAEVVSSRVANYAHPDYPELEDFGDCMITGKNGTSNYFRVDWFTPDGLRTWGDGRTFILGTEGYIEIRKYIDIAHGSFVKDRVFLINGKGEQCFDAEGKTGFPFFNGFLLDLINRTENAMIQEHALKAAELCLKAEASAVNIG